ncbi:MAG: T9SS type A sorting domain-containing protein, partial [Bacteroidota bacterium]
NADLAVRVYPNPATEYVNFEYSGSSDVRLSIFDSMGNPVASPQSIGGSGDMIFRWNGCDATGRRLPAGAYFYRLAGSSESHKGKLILE